MALVFKVYGTIDAIPSVDEILELLEESEFEVTIESDDGDEEEWEDLMVYETSLEEPVSLYRIFEDDAIEEEVNEISKRLLRNGNAKKTRDLIHAIDNCVIVYGVEVSDEEEEDDNALVLSLLIVQLLAQRTDGVYSVDAEGFFNDAGDLIYELAAEE